MPNYTEQHQSISFSANISVGIQELANVQIWQPNTAYNCGDVVTINTAYTGNGSYGVLENDILLCILPGTSGSNVANIQLLPIQFGFVGYNSNYGGTMPNTNALYIPSVNDQPGIETSWSTYQDDGNVVWVRHPNYPLPFQWNGSYANNDITRLPNGRIIKCIIAGDTGNPGDTPLNIATLWPTGDGIGQPTYNANAWANTLSFTTAYGANGYWDQPVLYIGGSVWISDTKGFQYRTDGNTALWIDPSTY